MQNLLLVGIGGFFGAILRHGISSWTLAGAMAGTLLVNLLGGLAIGGLLGAVDRPAPMTETTRLLLVVGFLGSFTTFSTFSKQTLDLLQSDGVWKALGLVLAHVTLGVLAVWVGTRLATPPAG